MLLLHVVRHATDIVASVSSEHRAYCGSLGLFLSVCSPTYAMVLETEVTLIKPGAGTVSAAVYLRICVVNFYTI